jgi:hypothetical protein
MPGAQQLSDMCHLLLLRLLVAKHVIVAELASLPMD